MTKKDSKKTEMREDAPQRVSYADAKALWEKYNPKVTEKQTQKSKKK